MVGTSSTPIIIVTMRRANEFLIGYAKPSELGIRGACKVLFDPNCHVCIFLRKKKMKNEKKRLVSFGQDAQKILLFRLAAFP